MKDEFKDPLYYILSYKPQVKLSMKCHSKRHPLATALLSCLQGIRLWTLLLYVALFATGCFVTTLRLHCSSPILPDGPPVARHSVSASASWNYLRSEKLSDKDASKARVLAQQPPNTTLPADFSWQSYLLRYPDLRAANVRNERSAAWHYIYRGRQEGRSYQRVNILLRYTACQGLFNQVYAHMNAFILAEFLGADVVLPPSVFRESFAKYFTMDDRSKNEVRWMSTGTDALLDVEGIKGYYAQKGRTVYSTPPIEAFPDCMYPGSAFLKYLMPELRPEQVVRLPNIYLQSMPIWYLWDKAAKRVMDRYEALVNEGWPKDSTIVLDLPCPFLAISTLTCLEEAQSAAVSLKFNRHLVELAHKVIDGMRAKSIFNYTGAHLRLEKDAKDWAQVLGGMDKYMQMYAQCFAVMNYDISQPMYVASGLLSYNASKEMEELLDFLSPFSQSVEYKEKYISQEELRKLNTEQQALVDFLVLANARKLVGLGSSTFSVYLREYRVLLGHNRASNRFIDTSRIGTDALFERSTHFAPLDVHKLAEADQENQKLRRPVGTQ